MWYNAVAMNTYGSEFEDFSKCWDIRGPTKCIQPLRSTFSNRRLFLQHTISILVVVAVAIPSFSKSLSLAPGDQTVAFSIDPLIPIANGFFWGNGMIRQHLASRQQLLDSLLELFNLPTLDYSVHGGEEKSYFSESGGTSFSLQLLL